MKQKTKILNIGLLITAFLFLFNPNVIVIDFLPDFIGYIFLVAALIPLGDISYKISDAAAGFKKMIFIDAGKWLAILWIFGMSLESEKTASMLLWTFVFCVLELIFAIPAYLNLFGGMLSLADFYDNTSIHGSKNGKKKNYTESIRLFTVIFVVLKAVMAFAPEMAEFGNSSYDESSAFLNIYRFIGLLRGMAFIAVLVMGIVWLFKVIRYFWRVKKDTVLMDALADAYNEKVLPKTGIFANRTFKAGMTLLVAGSILTLDLRLADINVLPDLLAGGVFLGFAIYMNRRIFKFKKPLIVDTALYLLVSCAVAVMEYRFYPNHSFLSVLRNPESAENYWSLVAMTVIQILLFLAVMIRIIRELKRVISEHTGYVVGKDYNVAAEERQTAELHKELSRPLTYTLAALVLYALTDLLNLLQVFFYAYFEAEFGYLYTVNFVAGIVFVGFLLKALWEIQEAVKVKYMLE